LIVALLLIPSVTFAQSEPVDDAPAEDVPPEAVEITPQSPAAPLVVLAPAPLTATLVKVGSGVHLFPPSTQSAMPPSPVGAPIFENMLGHLPASHELRLARNGIATYTFPCTDGQCTGGATVVWNAMPEVQREDYLRAMIGYAQQIAPKAKWAQVQIRVSDTTAMVQCATTLSGSLTFNDGVCPTT
jgi:hypothetical protein